jgi:integrase/recombinase XerD
MSYSYFGNFKQYIESLIIQKQSLGYPYQSSARILRMFDEYCNKYFPDEQSLNREIVMEWASLKQDEHPNGLLRRVTPVRQLAKYMNSIGIESYVIPSKVPKKQIHYVPHIYTVNELEAFFHSLDMCQPSPFSPGRHLIIPVFFRLLYCCGLRSSEARLLSKQDVDLDEGSLFIRQSKGHKDRMVCLSDDLILLCRTYNERISLYYPDREAFFPNQQGSFYNDSIIDYWFHLFWDDLAVAGICVGNVPRVHDFRHTFAVNRLNLWVRQGKDINAYLPYLSMYLGHVNQADTDYYLHLVPEFFPVLKEKSRTVFEELIPEAHHE